MASNGIPGMPKNPDPNFRRVLVTPDLARQWLGLMGRNRRPRDRYKDEYAETMIAGDWKNTGESVKFDTKGVLVDGQHRLMAIITSGKAVWMTVALNVDEDAILVMDTSFKRGIGDTMDILKEKNSFTLAACVRFLIAFDKGQIRGPQTAGWPSTSRVKHFAYADEHPGLRDSITLATGQWRPIQATVTAIGCSHHLVSRAIEADPRFCDQDAATEFFETVAERRTDGRGDPRFTLSVKLSDYPKKTNSRNTLVTQCHMINRAFNAWVRGEALYKMPLANVPFCAPVAPSSSPYNPPQWTRHHRLLPYEMEDDD